MSSKDIIRAGESGGRRAAIREELLPSHIPLPKPTRDISASNRSHSIIHQEAPQPYSDRRILDRETEEFEYEKQANIVYNRQFKSIAKLLGNQSMDFDQLKQRIENLLVKESSNSEPDLKYKIQMLEKELARKEDQRSSQYLGNSEYIKTMEAQLSRKNKLISELCDSVKKQAFHEAFKELELEVSSKERDLIAMEGQLHEMRVKSATQISTLEEEIIKRNQNIQKVNFELESLKRKLKTVVEQNERAKKREKQLLLSLQTEAKVSYQGITYSANSLSKQLQTRDQQIHEMIDQHRALEEETSNLKEMISRLNKNLEMQESTASQLSASLEYYKSLTNRQTREIQQFREETCQLKADIQNLQERDKNNKELLSQLQKREKALLLQCREYETEMKSLQFNHQAIASQLNELSSRGQADKTLIAQLSSAFSQQKQKYTSTLVNFQTIQQKLLEEVEARAKLEATLHQKQQYIVNQEAHFKNYSHQKQQHQAEYINESNALQQRLNLLMRELQEKDVDITSLQARIKESVQNQRQQVQEKEHFKKANIALEEEIKHLEIRLAEQNSQLQDCYNRIKLAEQQAEVIEALRIKLEAAQVYEAQVGQLNEQLHQEELQKKELVEQYQSVKAQLQEKAGQLRSRQANMQRLNTRIEELAVELEHKISLIEETNRKIQHLEQQLELKQGALEEKTQLSLQIEQQHESRYRESINQYAQKIQILERQIEDGQKYKHQAQHLQLSLQSNQQQLNHLSEEYRRVTALLDQKTHQQTALQIQLASLRTTLDEKDSKLQHAQQNSSKIVLLEQQLHRLHSEEAQLRLLLDEAAEKETHWENRLEHQRIELQQLRLQMQHEKQLVERERVQMQEKLEIMHEQLDREKAQYEEQVQSRHQLEQQISQLQRLYKQSDFSRQQTEMELSHQKNQNYHLSTRITEIQSVIQEKQMGFLAQKQRLMSEIERINAGMLEQEKNLKSNLIDIKVKHDKQINIIQTKLNEVDDQRHILEQEKQYLAMTIAELQREKEESQAQQERAPTLSNDLDNCTFNYYGSQEQMANDTLARDKEALLERIEELQSQVEQLRHQLQGKSTELVYSKSQEEESLKFMLSSLQEEKHLADLEIQRLKTEQLTKIVDENQALREHIKELTTRIGALQMPLQNIRQHNAQQRSMQTFNTQLINLKENYAMTLKDLQNKNQLLLLDLSRFEEKIELLLKENRLHKQESMSEKEEYQRKIQQLEADLETYKNKEAEMNQEFIEINALLGQIQIMKEQMQSFQQECRQLAAARTELQVRNAQLEAWNNQLQTLLVTQKQDEQQRILSRLSKKSNVSGEGENKRQHTYSDAPSSDGELSRKILNYDPSKISGQESKFAPHLVFQNSKIHVVREPLASPDPEARAEIKQQRNQESILSKTLQDREKSISSSPRQLQDRRSEASRRQTPKQILTSKEIIQQRQKTNSLKNDGSRNHSDSIPSKKNISELNHSNNVTNSHQQGQTVPNQAPEVGQITENHNESVTIPSRDTRKEEYLPQQSSKKTIQSNESKKKMPEEEVTKEPFQKKSHFHTIVPVYTARPSIIQNFQEEERRDNSGSRSSSRGKITISYGRPADSSIDKKSIKQVQIEERREFSKNSSRMSQIGALGTSPPHEISPISIRRPQAYTPTQSLRQSMHKQGQSQVKLLKESIVQPVEKLHSESIINKVSNISVRFSSVAGGGRPPTLEINRPSHVVKREVPTEYIPPKIDTVISPRITNISYQSLKASNQFNPKTRIQITQDLQLLKPELQPKGLQPQATVETQKKDSKLQQTPIKVSMKRVSSGKRLNSGFGDSLTFGMRSRQENDSVASSSQDSGIEVMQYDWTAPCCKP